jgi:hypothetical protein
MFSQGVALPEYPCPPLWYGVCEQPRKRHTWGRPGGKRRRGEHAGQKDLRASLEVLFVCSARVPLPSSVVRRLRAATQTAHTGATGGEKATGSRNPSLEVPWLCRVGLSLFALRRGGVRKATRGARPKALGRYKGAGGRREKSEN